MCKSVACLEHTANLPAELGHGAQRCTERQLLNESNGASSFHVALSDRSSHAAMGAAGSQTSSSTENKPGPDPTKMLRGLTLRVHICHSGADIDQRLLKWLRHGGCHKQQQEAGHRRPRTGAVGHLHGTCKLSNYTTRCDVYISLSGTVDGRVVSAFAAMQCGAIAWPQRGTAVTFALMACAIRVLLSSCIAIIHGCANQCALATNTTE